MIQDQLVEYVSSQLKAGVSRDAVKAALTGVGWPAGDVEDTLKKVEGAGKPAAPAGAAVPAGAAPAGAMPMAGMPASVKPMSAMPSSTVKPSGPQPQSIRMSDLVSASTAGSVSPLPSVSPKAQSATARPMNAVAAPKRGRAMMIVGIVVVVALAGLAGFLYWENNGLAAKVASLGGESANVTSNLSSLNGQVEALTASNTVLTAQEASLTAENADLLNNLSFVAVPVGVTGASATSTVSVSGALTGGKSSYVLTTAYGVVIYVSNAKDAKVAAALTPLIGSTSTVQLAGTHAAGSQYILVTGVNGTAL